MYFISIFALLQCQVTPVSLFLKLSSVETEFPNNYRYDLYFFNGPAQYLNLLQTLRVLFHVVLKSCSHDEPLKILPVQNYAWKQEQYHESFSLHTLHCTEFDLCKHVSSGVNAPIEMNGGSNFSVCLWNPKVWSFKRKLPSGTFRLV